uniref:Rab-GAP TBC domain-containing protein n=1 Tax=Arcella intermedia TaxID=1963864 RepID=A0A6B2KYX1_9EUKA
MAINQKIKATSSTEYIIQKQTRNDFVFEKFRIPNNEVVVADYPVAYWHFNSYARGVMILTRNFLLFGNPKIKFVLPLCRICEITKKTVVGIRESAIEMTTLHNQSFFFKMPSSERDGIYKQIMEMYSLCSNPIVPISSTLPPLKKRRNQFNLGVEILNNREHFSADYIEKQAVTEEYFEDYLNKHAIGDFGIVQTVDFHNAVRGGIPDSYRAHIWKICSGALVKEFISEKTFEQILAENEGKETYFTDIIDRDLHRSLPEHPFYHTEEGIKGLSNVLRAFSFFNPIIGYCQAMNYIAAGLLLFMSQKEAFWTLCVICEDLVPSNFRPHMIGTLLEQRIFEYLVEYFMPDVASHFSKCGVPLVLVSAPWFLCLFIGFLPLEVAFRVLDRWFCVNTDALYQVGLALIKMRKEEILQATRIDQFSAIFKEHTYDINQLLEIAWVTHFKTLPKHEMNEIKNEYQFFLIQGIHQQSKNKQIQNLMQTIDFTKDEVQILVDIWYKILPPNASGMMSYDHFVDQFHILFPFWLHLRDGDLPSKIFASLLPDDGDSLKIEQFIAGIDKIYKTNINEKWSFIKAIYGLHQSSVPKKHLVSALNVFLNLFLPMDYEQEDKVSIKVHNELLKDIEAYVDEQLIDVKTHQIITEKVDALDLIVIMKHFGVDPNILSDHFQYFLKKCKN